MKLPLIASVFLSILASIVLYQALTVHFTFEERPLVNLSIGPLLDSITSYLTIHELTSVCRTISHKKSRCLPRLRMLDSVVPGALILEVRVLLNISIAALAMPQLSNRINITHKAILLQLILAFILHHLHLFKGHRRPHVHIIQRFLHFQIYI